MGETREKGREAEDAAATFLEGAGYRVLARNFSCRHGEVDIVVERGGTLAFVEVRSLARAIFGLPSETIGHAKRRRVVKTALHYLFRNGMEGRMVRFDVVSIVGWGAHRKLEHIPDAFDAGM